MHPHQAGSFRKPTKKDQNWTRKTLVEQTLNVISDASATEALTAMGKAGVCCLDTVRLRQSTIEDPR